MSSIVSKFPLTCGILSATLLLAPLAGGASESALRYETRCGWFSNPTPANISLYDRDGEWVIGAQGGHQVEGDWDWPAFKSKQWVPENGPHGYGCACLELHADPKTHRVLAIRSARARRLATCRQDPSLKRWRELFK
ncbi:MAG: DUF4087 domain-containing protein [Syntrophobacteraceae bacterium]